MVFVIGKAFVNLGASDLRETRRERIDRFTILKQANNIVDANASALYASHATADFRVFRDVTVCRGLKRHV